MLVLEGVAQDRRKIRVRLVEKRARGGSSDVGTPLVIRARPAQVFPIGRGEHNHSFLPEGVIGSFAHLNRLTVVKLFLLILSDCSSSLVLLLAGVGVEFCTRTLSSISFGRQSSAEK